MKARAPAKINLALHILGRRASDGYHLLDSLVTFADLEDEIFYLSSAKAGWEIHVTGPHAAGVPQDGTNLAARVAQAMGARFQRSTSGQISISKQIPHGAGLGGGSMDGAAMAWMLSDAWALSAAEQAELPSLLQPMGADMTLALSAWNGAWQRVEGVGETVIPIAPLCGDPVHAVLTHASEVLDTAKVYAACLREDDRQALPETLPSLNGTTELAEWLIENTSNGLEAAACRIGTTVQPQLEALRATEDCLLARMSGSGSACFGLYPHARAAQNAVEHLRAGHPEWWVCPTLLGQKAPAIEERNV